MSRPNTFLLWKDFPVYFRISTRLGPEYQAACIWLQVFNSNSVEALISCSPYTGEEKKKSNRNTKEHNVPT